MKYSSRAVVILIFFERNNVHCKTFFFHRYIYFRKLNMVLTTKVNMTSLILIWLFLLLLLELENKCEQSDDGKIWKRNILFWITFGVQFFKWKAREKNGMSFVFFWDITHHQLLSYFDPRALFLQKQGPQKLKGGKANVLKNSKILRRSFFQNIIMHYYWHQH